MTVSPPSRDRGHDQSQQHERAAAQEQELQHARTGTLPRAMPDRPFPLALHKWTLHTTSLPGTLRVARETGWDGVELRREDFQAAIEALGSAEAVLDLLRSRGLPVASVGVQLGWMAARGDERRALLAVVREQAERAVALGCGTLMSPADRGPGDVAQAADSIREVGDLVARHGLRLGLEPISTGAYWTRTARVREALARAGHPHVGLLVDTYHFQRAGETLDDLTDIRGDEIVYVQYSDVPAGPLEPGQVLNRLPPGRGVVPFREFFAALAARGYAGTCSYEAPNPAAWERKPEDVCREALAATLAVLP